MSRAAVSFKRESFDRAVWALPEGKGQMGLENSPQHLNKRIEMLTTVKKVRAH